MKIALYNLEPKIHNSAMMQVSTYHKQRGDEVCIYEPLLHDTYDKIYAFSLFDFTDKGYVRDDMICGGTGFDITSKLPKEIEECDLDYSVCPTCDYSIIWFSRGCFRDCPFCIVNQKEGYIHPVKPKNLNPNGKYIKVMDNNFFANPEWRKAIKQLVEWGQPVDLQGFDIRLLDKEQCSALNKIKWYKSFKFAWDNPRDNIDDKIELLLQYMKPYKLTCYVLIGYWSTPEEDMRRVMHLHNKYKINPYVMPYNKFDEYQKNFARWVNAKPLFKSITFDEYLEYKKTRRKYTRRKKI